MTDQQEDRQGVSDPVEEVARLLRSLDDRQLLQLFSLLTEAGCRESGTEHASIGVEGDPVINEEHVQAQDAVPLSVNAQGFWRRLGTGMAMDRELWKNIIANTVPLAIALIAAPIVVPWTFERDRAAAQPRISIEYAFLSYQNQPLPADIVALITETSRQPIYRSFVQSRLMSGHVGDIGAFTVPGAGLGPKLRQQLLTEVAAFRTYLLETQRTLASDRAELANLSNAKVRSFAFRVLDDPSSIDETAPREFLSRALEQKASSVNSLLAAADKLDAAVAASSPGIRVRLTLLNRGATDGLVRHHGELKYRGAVYPIVRSAPPTDFDTMAMSVPVFQTNAVTDDFAPQSVGKVEQDSMAEFWYALTPAVKSMTGTNSLCVKGEKIEVTLYDHNKNVVSAVVDCNQEET